MNTNFFKKQMELYANENKCATPIGDLEAIHSALVSNIDMVASLLEKLNRLGGRLYGSLPSNEVNKMSPPMDGQVNYIKFKINEQRDGLSECHSIIDKLSEKL